MDVTKLQRMPAGSRRLFLCRLAVGALGLATAAFPAMFQPQALGETSEEAVILTPKPPAAPRINGPRVFGVRPRAPFLFTIPATGHRPLRFAVDGLPEGLEVDPETGRITGSLIQPRTHRVVFRAENAFGRAEREFKIVCGDAIALTPHMGWNSWYVWESRVTDKVVRDAADAMVSTGMINYGWSYVNIDDCWAVMPGSQDPVFGGPPRDDQGNILPNKRFPDMKALTDYIHAKGLKAGIYTSPGPLTCGKCTGAYRHEEQDARQFARWGFDFLKYDWCSYRHVPKENGLAGLQKPYRQMGAILKRLDRDIVLNLCQYGMGDVWQWGREVGGHSWRTADDLGGSFSGIPAALFRDAFELYGRNQLQPLSGPGAWNDPDYLLLGYLSDWKGGFAPTPLTPNEQYAHVSLWCLLAAPLILSGDITRLDAFTLSLLTNDEVIEVDQDPLGKSAIRVAKSGDLEVWAKDMADGSKAVGLFNRGERETAVTATWSDLGIGGRQTVRDLWRQKDLGAFEGEFSARVGRHGVVLVRMAPEQQPSVPESEAGFVSMFNGQDLTGWEGEPGYWSVEENAITGTTTADKPLDHATYLFWRGGQPANFELRASYRFKSPAGNSGINFRSAPLARWDVKGYQADMEAGPNYSGILYECNQRDILAHRGQEVVIREDGRREVVIRADSAALQKKIKPNDWNEYVIVAQGPKITLKINGVVTSRVVDREKGKAAAAGLITLQVHPGPPMKVQFKNLRIKQLP